MGLILTIVGIVAVISVIGMHNRIIGNFNAVKRAWSDVHASQNQKSLIITKLETLLKEHNVYESSLIEKVTQYRTKIDDLVMTPNSETINSSAVKEVETASKGLMASIRAVAEDNPELKTSDLYRSLMGEVASQQANVGAAIRTFNSNVQTHNTEIEEFPNVLVNTFITKKKSVDSFSDEAVKESFKFDPELD